MLELPALTGLLCVNAYQLVFTDTFMCHDQITYHSNVYNTWNELLPKIENISVGHTNVQSRSFSPPPINSPSPANRPVSYASDFQDVDEDELVGV